MSATKYQVLVRYFNTNTNNAVTNNPNSEYVKELAFYTTDKSEIITEKIIEGNSPTNIKTDMLFAYNGTHIIYPDKNNKQQLEKISNDFTKVNFDATDDYYSAKFRYPYAIIDQYKRVMFSPWFSVHTCGSLNSALEKAKQMVNSIGINNVKIIKVVAIDEFVKVK